jgi:tetratricopeptide (TPR) repeat protein
VLVALGDLYRLTGAAAEADRQYALVEAVQRLNKANGVRGDAQIAQFYADHDRNLPEALRMAEEEYKTRKSVFVADTLAWCYYKNGRYQEAKRAARKALSRNTPVAEFLFHAGMIDAKLGDVASAQRYLYQALSLNPNFSPVFAPVAADTITELGAGAPAPKPGPPPEGASTR